MPLSRQKALLLLSGGQDSTTCLGWSLNTFEEVSTVQFDYGQRHKKELLFRKTILEKIPTLSKTWANALGEDYTLTTDLFSQLGTTALTTNIEISYNKKGIPNTFVPGRNILFLTTAAALAWNNGIKNIIIGVCETDFSGYPDCRDNTIKALQVAISLGLGEEVTIHTPLMHLTKAQIWDLADKTGGAPFIELIRTQTLTCYLGDTTTINAWGYGCTSCPACILRKNGWEEFMSQQHSKHT